MGTLRHDGWPRICPVEPFFHGTDLLLGMIWHSRKAQDLLRDPRCVLHSVVTDPDANEGEFKLSARAIPASDLSYLAHIRDNWGLTPRDPVHVFRIDVVSASFTTYLLEQGLMIVKKWDPSEGETESRRHYP
jgi:hypothetical protein